MRIPIVRSGFARWMWRSMRSDIKDEEALEALTENLRDARKAVSIPLLYHQSLGVVEITTGWEKCQR